MNLYKQMVVIGTLCNEEKFDQAMHMLPGWQEIQHMLSSFSWNTAGHDDYEALVGIACLQSFADRVMGGTDELTLAVQEMVLTQLARYLLDLGPALKTPRTYELLLIIRANMADRYRATEEWAKAAAHFERPGSGVFEKNPVGAINLAMYGLMHLQQGNHTAAEALLLPACQFIAPWPEHFGTYISTVAPTALSWLYALNSQTLMRAMKATETPRLNVGLLSQLTTHAGGGTPQQNVWTPRYLPLYRRIIIN